jgi:hypothetical protein
LLDASDDSFGHRVAQVVGETSLRRAASCPGDALRHGAISYSQVRAITRVATVENEETLLVYAAHMTGAQLEKTCRLYRASQRETDGEGARSQRFVRRHDRDDGMVDIHLRLRPEEAAVVWAAIERRAGGTQAIRTLT